jgi:hypothetical protein
MDEFSIQVEKEDVEPLLRGIEEKMPEIDIDNAELRLYQIPLGRKTEEAHQKRLDVLKPLKSREILKLSSFLKRHRALPVIKVITTKAEYVVKPTHSQVSLKTFDNSQKNIRFEFYVSELASQLDIGPKVYTTYYYNPRLLLMVEECISSDKGWKNVWRYSGKLDLKKFPKSVGEMLGKLHKLRNWKTRDNNEFKGHLWYYDRVLLHSFYNQNTDSLRLVDFGDVELLSPENKSRLSWDVEETVKELIYCAFPFDRQITKNNKDKYEDVIGRFLEAYNKETNMNYRIPSLAWLMRSSRWIKR